MRGSVQCRCQWEQALQMCQSNIQSPSSSLCIFCSTSANMHNWQLYCWPIWCCETHLGGATSFYTGSTQNSWLQENYTKNMYSLEKECSIMKSEQLLFFSITMGWAVDACGVSHEDRTKCNYFDSNLLWTAFKVTESIQLVNTLSRAFKWFLAAAPVIKLNQPCCICAVSQRQVKAVRYVLSVCRHMGCPPEAQFVPLRPCTFSG